MPHKTIFGLLTLSLLCTTAWAEAPAPLHSLNLSSVYGILQNGSSLAAGPLEGIQLSAEESSSESSKSEASSSSSSSDKKDQAEDEEDEEDDSGSNWSDDSDDDSGERYTLDDL